jgi:hypothetical protein
MEAIHLRHAQVEQHAAGREIRDRVEEIHARTERMGSGFRGGEHETQGAADVAIVIHHIDIVRLASLLLCRNHGVANDHFDSKEQPVTTSIKCENPDENAPDAARNRFDAQRKRFIDGASKPLTNRLHCAANRGSVAVNGWNALVLLIETKGEKT